MSEAPHLRNDCHDSEARARADRAQGQIDGHERLCAERWEANRREIQEMRKQSASQYRDIKASIGNLYARLWWAVGLGFAVAGGLIVWLADKAFP